jgi:hypothetical protein
MVRTTLTVATRSEGSCSRLHKEYPHTDSCLETAFCGLKVHAPGHTGKANLAHVRAAR